MCSNLQRKRLGIPVLGPERVVVHSVGDLALKDDLNTIFVHVRDALGKASIDILPTKKMKKANEKLASKREIASSTYFRAGGHSLGLVDTLALGVGLDCALVVGAPLIPGGGSGMEA